MSTKKRERITPELSAKKNVLFTKYRTPCARISCSLRKPFGEGAYDDASLGACPNPRCQSEVKAILAAVAAEQNALYKKNVKTIADWANTAEQQDISVAEAKKNAALAINGTLWARKTLAEWAQETQALAPKEVTESDKHKEIEDELKANGMFMDDLTYYESPTKKSKTKPKKSESPEKNPKEPKPSVEEPKKNAEVPSFETLLPRLIRMKACCAPRPRPPSPPAPEL